MTCLGTRKKKLSHIVHRISLSQSQREREREKTAMADSKRWLSRTADDLSDRQLPPSSADSSHLRLHFLLTFEYAQLQLHFASVYLLSTSAASTPSTVEQVAEKCE